MYTFIVNYEGLHHHHGLRWVTTSIFDSTPADPLNCSDGNDIEGRGDGKGSSGNDRLFSVLSVWRMFEKEVNFLEIL